jgi:hypothetical protein
MILTARIVCLLACLYHLVGCAVVPAADRAGSPPVVASFHQDRPGPPAGTIGQPRRATHAGREAEDAADLEGESDDDSSDHVSLPWSFSAVGTEPPSLILNSSVTARGVGSAPRSAVLRC